MFPDVAVSLNETAHLPFFSVVIPTFDRVSQLAGCIRSLAALDYPRYRFEVIVVNDGGNEPLEPVVEPYRNRMSVRSLYQQNAGPGVARNTGCDEATGDLVCFIDDDCRVEADWLRKLTACVRQHPCAMIGGRTVNMLTENRYSCASQMLISYLYEYYITDQSDAVFITSNNMTVPRAKFLDVGGFDSRFCRNGGEDRELCDRWCFKNNRIVYDPSIVVHHAHRLTFLSFCRQHYCYGSGATFYHRLRAERRQNSLRVEPLLFYLQLLAYPYRNTSNERLQKAFLLFLSQLFNAVGFFASTLGISKCFRPD